ncbi:Os02g0256500 [Oryza sativa Japonica Group]|uniref:Os02g0256500 protein n=3 Tax=Oryza TaxID=4527 RepID=Q0E2A4_ORYSJ|nr:hypothetical protein DAI22_02g112100 [Oryza sativa Japonica Group]BAD27956.1 unknown protein [Oryza sativa Japonica Group]BAD29703.1 unknown protein [Oryza sativa Japonica Group]BAF08384.1 Os02g0256500 [Oryza sativa Japonica Group]BAG98617.1 unnamed protein product [Oryza sativa Japonica Group]|eukprot:NP_001046470.1 Os02g0256500 [Oryza sativa Japonica Group]
MFAADEELELRDVEGRRRHSWGRAVQSATESGRDRRAGGCDQARRPRRRGPSHRVKPRRRSCRQTPSSSSFMEASNEAHGYRRHSRLCRRWFPPHAGRDRPTCRARRRLPC